MTDSHHENYKDNKYSLTSSGLISYQRNSDEESSENNSVKSENLAEVNTPEQILNIPETIEDDVLTIIDGFLTGNNLKIHNKPMEECSEELQTKITHLLNQKREQNLDLTQSIYNRKAFRNPSIYEKLVSYCKINEKGSNFEKDIYSVDEFTDKSYYEALDKAQRLWPSMK